ncbi:hypothetical protein [Asticcacaulis sp.]|uniref:hypothetical protein n=1 Tax=Asticcacaulis sp. TaxID=1872648 RepID=UPI0025BFBAC7|nr:hypothetical protein [Asticcacaulis sp.]
MDGQIVCLDVAARAKGCVPVNPFGIGSISTAAADYTPSYPVDHALPRFENAGRRDLALSRPRANRTISLNSATVCFR